MWSHTEKKTLDLNLDLNSVLDLSVNPNPQDYKLQSWS